jgi:hypothetical protein
MKKVYLILMGMLLLVGHAWASAIWYVDVSATAGSHNGSSWTDAYTDLATAINAASDGDDIYVATGTYSIEASLPYRAVKIYGGFNGESGPADRAKVNNGKPWEFTNPTVIDATGWTAGADRIFADITAAATELLLDGLTFQNRECTEIAPLIYAHAGLVMQNCIVRNNKSTCSTSSGDGDGGIILLDAGLTGNFLIKDCKIASNEVVKRGTICIRGGTAATVHISGCELNNNKTRNGGAISLRSDAWVLVENTTMIANESTFEGGAIRQENGKLLLQNCVLAKNHANSSSYGHGAAIYKENGTLSIFNCVIADNTSNGSTTIGAALNGVANIYNTVFYNNSKGDVSGTQTTFYYNIIAPEPPFTAGGGNITSFTGSDLFTDAANGDYSTKPGSPAINAGKAVLRDKDNKPVPTWATTSIGLISEESYFRLLFPKRSENFVEDMGAGSNVEVKSIDKTKDEQLWTFIPVGKGYRIANKSTGRELTHSGKDSKFTAGASGSGRVFRIEATTGNHAGFWLLRTGDAFNIAFNKESSGALVSAWETVGSNNDDGNALAFVPETDPAIFTSVNSINFGNMIVNGANRRTSTSVWAYNFTSGSTIALTSNIVTVPSSSTTDDAGYAKLTFDLSFSPTESGDITDMITVSSGEVSTSINISGTAVDLYASEGDDEHWYYIRAAGTHKQDLVFHYNGDNKNIVYAEPVLNCAAQLWKILKTPTGNKIVNKADGGSLAHGDYVTGGSGGIFYSALTLKSDQVGNDKKNIFEIANDGTVKIHYLYPESGWRWIGHEDGKEIRNRESGYADLFKFVTPAAMHAESGHLTVSTAEKEWWYQIQFNRRAGESKVVQNNGVGNDLTQTASITDEKKTWWKIVETAGAFKIVAYDGSEFGFTGTTDADNMQAVAAGTGNSFYLRSSGGWWLEMEGAPVSGHIYANDRSGNQICLYGSDTNGNPITFIYKHTNWVIEADAKIQTSKLTTSDEIVFKSTDTTTGQLTAGDGIATTFQSPGKVKLVKTFKTDQWYPIGFPFEVDTDITIKYGTTTVAGVIYDGDKGLNGFHNNGTKGNFFVKKYDAGENYFVFDDEIAANTGYIVEFPKEEFGEATEVEVTFVSTTSPELKIGGTGTSISSAETNLSLVVNSNVSNISSFEDAMDYYQYESAANRFVRRNSTSLSTALKPFEAIVAVKTGTTVFRSSIGDGSSITAIRETLPKFNVREVRYYTLQGIRIDSPKENGVYIVKKTYVSGKTDVFKTIYKK